MWCDDTFSQRNKAGQRAGGVGGIVQNLKNRISKIVGSS